MAEVLVFYADQLLEDCGPVYRVSSLIPDGAYIRAATGYWYIRQWDSNVPINESDVPETLKAWVLLLDP